ncbi:hypothetical protein ACH5RR_012152 [Cinchona calisaya]|uniref:Phytocyanin domain-containing protein n=1 Tax=Cinchona calisaya TaxID=153742 RepID=A0ABD3A6X7_9GENT
MGGCANASLDLWDWLTLPYDHNHGLQRLLGVDFSRPSTSEFPPLSRCHFQRYEVNREDYNSCKAKSALATDTTGNDLINLTSAGDYYYISSFPAQCEGGQWVHIKVGSISAALRPNSAPTLGKVPKPPIPFPPHVVVVYPYPHDCASTSISSKCLIMITTILGLALVADLYLV